MPDWRKLRAGIERLEGHRELLRSDASPWDWYAESCPCGRPVGECREHPRRGSISGRPTATGGPG